MIIRIYHECEGRIEKSVPRITDWHHMACQVMTNGDREGRILLSHPHTKNGFFSSFLTSLIKVQPAWGRHAAVRFLSFPRAGTGISIWCARK